MSSAVMPWFIRRLKRFSSTSSMSSKVYQL